SAARKNGARKRDPGLLQHLHMPSMLKHDPFEDRAQHVPLGVPTGKTEKTATKMRSEPAAVKKRMKERIVWRGRRLSDEIVHQRERIPGISVTLDQSADIPFEVRTGGGAVVHVHEPAGTLGGDHEHT